MAFATANLRRNPQGSHMTLVGTWTGTDGDDEGTLTLKRVGRVYDAAFWDSSAGTPLDARVPVSISISAGTATITVHNRRTVTQGRFRIEYL